MTLLDSLLDAIVRLDGDALVMHVGEKPYVVTTSSAMNAYRGPLAWGQVELSSRVLTPDAVMSMVGQILPVDQRHALDEIGAVEHEIGSPAGVADRFSVVAARGGDDIWLELRRHPADAAAPAGDSVQAGPESGVATDDAAALPASGPVPGAAVGLQEPPPPPSDTGIEPPASREEPPHAPETADEIAREAERPASDEISERAIEEHVAVVDEMRHEAVEHVERVLIPVPDEEGRIDAGSEPDAALELVEAEPQDAPTDQDVDAMLAATAASLLSANLKSDAPDAERPAPDEGFPGLAQEFADSMFEVVQEEEEQAGDEEAVPEPASDVDFTDALDEMPAAQWLPELSGQPAETVNLETKADSPSDAADIDVAIELDVAEVEEPAAQPAEPALESSPAAAGAEQHVEEAGTPAPEEQPEQAPAAAVAEMPDTRRETRDAEPSITSERPVELPAALPASGSQTPMPGVARIAAGAHDTAHGVVVPIDRGRLERPDAGGRVDDERLQQILRAAAERGASTVYVVAQSAPMIRVDGEIGVLDAEAALNAEDIDRLVAALAPSRQAGMPVEPGAEWISEVPRVGRVRCVAFRDHRGPGLIFRLISAKSISAEQLNLSQEIRELCTLSDGLVLVAGARGSGKSTLLDSFVDLINRTRSEHVITVETELAFVHESGRSFISQREYAGGQAAAAAVHSALREDPDVLVVEDVQSPEMVRAVLHAAESGRLVFASISASSSAAAVDALIDLMPEPEHTSARTALSSVLRAIVSQLLLRKASGGRVAARELLLNSPAAAASIRNSDPAGIAAALEAGGRYGMVPMNDSLAALVRAGTVHGAEAYRRAADRQGLLASLARDGVDTSFAERLA